MPDDSSGIYSVPAGTIVSTGDTILPSQHNPWAIDSASAISARFSKDGRAPATGNWNLNGFRMANVGAPVAGGDAVNKTYVDTQPIVDVASSATTDIGAAASRNVRITGSVTITSFGTAAAGTYRLLRFAAPLTLTHNGTSLILPGSANITTTADDTIEAISLGSGNWFLFSYQSRGGIITPWVAYTPTLTGFGTPSSVTFRSRRVGGNLEVFGRFTPGTATVVEARVSIGFNGTDGNVAVSSFMNASIWAVGHMARSVTAASQTFLLATGGNAYLRFGLQSSGRAGLDPVTGDVAGPAAAANAIVASIPIEGWS